MWPEAAWGAQVVEEPLQENCISGIETKGDGSRVDTRQELRMRQALHSRTFQSQHFHAEGNQFPHWCYKTSCTKPVPLALGGKSLLGAGYPLIAPHPVAKEVSTCSY